MSSIKKVLYVSGSRAEYGIVKRLLTKLNSNEHIDLTIVVTGMHCESKFGNTWKTIENDGFYIDEKFPLNINTSSNSKIIESMSLCLNSFGNYFSKKYFDAVIILGDRYEIFSVAIAAAMNNLRIIHIHGGEKTLGNYDEFIRHSITKMSYLHLASTEEYKKRIIQMGENPERVFDVGSLGAENAFEMKLPDIEYLKSELKIGFRPYFVVVFHPETLNGNKNITKQTTEILNALELNIEKYDFIFIGSNSDTGSNKITDLINKFCEKYKQKHFKSIRPEEYLLLMKESKGILGNSSSGIIEAPSFKIPTLNIGDRQKGRVRGNSVIDVTCDCKKIDLGIKYITSQQFHQDVPKIVNPYFKEGVLNNMIKIISDFLKEDNKDNKDFHDIKFL